MRINSKRTRRSAALLLAVSLVIAACGDDDDDGGASDTTDAATETTGAATETTEAMSETTHDMEADGEPIKVGELTVSTGSLATLGGQVAGGIEMAVERINAAGGINGRPIELVSEEAGESPETAVAALQKLLTQDVAAIVGMQFTGYVIPESPILDAAGVPGLHAAQGPTVVPGDNGTEWGFRIVADDSIAARVLVPNAIEVTGATKVAILHTSIDYGTNFRDGIEEILAEQYPDVEIVTVQQHDGGDADFTPQLKAIEDSGAELVFSGQYPADVAKIANQRVERGIEIPFFWNNAADTALGFGLMEESVIEGDYVPNDVVPRWSEDESIQTWRQDYLDQFGSEPAFVGASWYSGMLMLANALESIDDPYDHEALKAALASTADFDAFHDLTTMGFVYTCDDQNNCHNRSRLYQITADGPVPIDTYEG